MSLKYKYFLRAIMFYFISGLTFGIKMFYYPLNNDEPPKYFYYITIISLLIAVFYFFRWISLFFEKRQTIS